MSKIISRLIEFCVVLSILFSTFSIGYVAYVFYTNQIYFSEIYSNTCVLIQEVLKEQKQDTISTNTSVKKQPVNETDSELIDEQVEHLTRLQELEENTMTMDLLVFIYGFLSSVFVSVGAYYIKKMKEESNRIQELYNTACTNSNIAQSNFNTAKTILVSAQSNLKNASNKLTTAKRTYSNAQKKINDTEAKIKLTEENVLEIKDELENQKNSFETTKNMMEGIINDCEIKQKTIDDFHISIQNIHKKIPYYDALQTANLVLSICFQCEKLDCNNVTEKTILANMLPRLNDTIKFLLVSVNNIEKGQTNDSDVLKFVLNEIQKSIERCGKLNKVYFSVKYVQKVKKEIKECSDIISA